ncbi:MAG TPA: outer membrane protein assembly factor BamE [Burkholderiaceae bacterium]|nr:outer membrane protein assembly factor BamE [Burkholderiaceae bacterium]
MPTPRRRPVRTQHWLAAGAIAVAAVLAGCDTQRIGELEVGVTTEADVRAKWGEPAAAYTDDDGTRVLEYPRQPAGQVNYMIAIGGDGKLVALRQVLKPANFAKVQPGWDKAQVRRLLGRAAKTQVYSLKQEEVWDWRYADGAENKVFSVSFDPNGRVTATATTLDPRDTGESGR